MNKQGSIIMTIFFVGFYFIIGMMFVNFFKDDITIARGVTGIDCATPDTDGDMISCLFVDGILPFFIIFILSTIAGVVTDKVIT